MDPHADLEPSAWVMRWVPMIRPGDEVLDVAASNVHDLLRPRRLVPREGARPPAMFVVEGASWLHVYRDEATPGGDDLVSVVEREGITGLTFPTLWDSEHGAYDLPWMPGIDRPPA